MPANHPASKDPTDPRPSEGATVSDIPIPRLIAWVLVAIGIIFGVAMFFQFGTRIAPALI